MHGDVGGQNNLGLIDPARIERIEIVKGAASALYGSDAIAGVVNIILKKHREKYFDRKYKSRRIVWRIPAVEYRTVQGW